MRKSSQKEAEQKVLQKCNEKNYTLIKPFIYKNCDTKNIYLKCNIDNYTWETTYYYFINNNRCCPKCVGNIKLSQKETEFNVLEKCKEKNYSLIEPFIYKNNKTKIFLKCNIDNNEWKVSYSDFIYRNKGCKKCSIKKSSIKRRITQEEAEQKVLQKCKEKNYSLVKSFTYLGKDNTILNLKCNIDKHEWNCSYNNFINKNTGCPKCAGNTKISQEEAEQKVLQKCKEKNYILVKSFTYKNNKTKIYLKCKIDNHKWYVTYNDFINGDKGCFICRIQKTTNKLKLSQEEAEQKVLQKCKEKNYTLVEPLLYKNNKTRLYLKCNNDNYNWNISYNDFINGDKGCSKCAGNTKITQKVVEKRVLQKCKEKNYTLVEPFIYKNNITKLYLKCNNDNHEWNITYSDFINKNTGCPMCSYRKNGERCRLTQEEAEQKVLEKCKEKNYTLVEPFIYNTSQKTILYLICNIHNHEWNIVYSDFIKNKGCPKCGNVYKPTQEEAKQIVLEKCKEKNYVLLNKDFVYINNKTKLHLKCLKDNYKWHTTYANFINRNRGCTKCGKENAINTIIQKYGEFYLKFIPSYNPNSIIYLDMISEKLDIPIQHALNGGEKKFKKYWVDGYIPEHNICIEWNEKHHYSKNKIEKDLKREQFIIDNFECKFININEKEFLKDIDNQLEIICKRINQIIFQSI